MMEQDNIFVSSNMTLWLTGRPCSGKTTISKRLREEMNRRGIQAVNLDGDAVRGRLNADLGFSQKDREENLRRVAHVAQLFNENDIFVIATFVSPTNDLRGKVRDIIENFRMCYVCCSLDECERRDVKGMYKKARTGEIKEFTGVSAPFEEPANPEIVVNSEMYSLEDCVQQVLRELNLKNRHGQFV